MEAGEKRERGEGSDRAAPMAGETEVVTKAQRRRFTAEYKRRIVREADCCHAPRRDRAAVYTLPANWMTRRDQWECAHAARAVLQIVALAALVFSVLMETPVNGSGAAFCREEPNISRRGSE